MACADLTRLAIYDRLVAEGHGDTFVTPSFSVDSLTVVPFDPKCETRKCAHPLHAEWFPSRAQATPRSAFVSDSSPVCRHCLACNRIMNLRNEERIKVQSEIARRDAKKRDKFPVENLSKRVSKAPVEFELDGGGRRKVGKKKTTEAVPKNVKIRSCVGCKVEFCFFPDHEAYRDLPDSFACNNCVDKVVCFGCNAAEEDMDAEMILCDGCLLEGAHFSCLGLDSVPSGSWYCRFCVWSHEKALLGEFWLCVECRLLNHSRWPKLANVCHGCRKHRRPASHLVSNLPKKFVKPNPLIDWVAEQPQMEDVLTWGWSDIADFCFVLAYGNGAADNMERESFVQALRQLNLTAREWLKKGAPEMADAVSKEKVDESIRPMFVWLVKGAQFLHAELPPAKVHEPFLLSEAIRSSQARSGMPQSWSSSYPMSPTPPPPLQPFPSNVVEKKPRVSSISSGSSGSSGGMKVAVGDDSVNELMISGLSQHEIVKQQREYQKYQTQQWRQQQQEILANTSKRVKPFVPKLDANASPSGGSGSSIGIDGGWAGRTAPAESAVKDVASAALAAPPYGSASGNNVNMQSREPYHASVPLKKQALSKAGLALAATADVSKKANLFGEDFSDEVMQDNFDDVSHIGDVLDDTLKRKRRLPGVRLLASAHNMQNTEICGLLHRLASNVSFDKFAGTFVWVRLEESEQWLPAQIVLLRDVPLEYLDQVLNLKDSIRQHEHLAVLVAYFTQPYRSFAWVFPQRGEVAEFNSDYIEQYMDFASMVQSKELILQLSFVKRTLMFDTPESINTEMEWQAPDQMRATGYDLGRLVWARPNGTCAWFPATVSSESEVPENMLSEVLEACTGKRESVLVAYFDVPSNLFGWVPLSDETIQPFRCLTPHVIRKALSATPRTAKIEAWILCARRALVFESLCVPSKAEGPRWMCRAGCGLANIPARLYCLLCRLPRSLESPLTFVVPRCVVGGSKLLESTTVRFCGLDVTFSGLDMPVKSASVLYRNISLIVFALASPTPFIAFYTRELNLRPRVVHAWSLLVLPSSDAPPKPGELSIWGLVFQV